MNKANFILFTQSSSLDMFYNLVPELNKFVACKQVGLYITDSRFYRKFCAKNSEIESGKYSLLKEWEIVRDANHINLDIDLLREYECKLGDPYLWNALIADRRIYFGKKYSYDQDYASRFTHEEMLSILQLALQRVEKLFDEVNPDFIVSFQCVTIGDYLSYLFARVRGIKVLNLRPTRIRNYFYAGESICEPTISLEKVYLKLSKDGLNEKQETEAKEYLQEFRDTHAMYEGVVPATGKPPLAIKGLNPFVFLIQFCRLAIKDVLFKFSKYRYDNHLSGELRALIATYLIKPWRSAKMNRGFRKIYIQREYLPDMEYAFFPLHTEPEVTLSVYSRPYLNQIEAVRLYSRNLPIGMKLIVKEHPWSIGKRPISYYHKLLDIPNVMLAHPALQSRELVANARLITVIAGSVGLEGLFVKKPVVVLGGAPYTFLPRTMVRHVAEPDQLGVEVRELLQNYECNDSALLAYISTIMQESAPIDFYSRLLGRKGTYNFTGLEKERDSRKERNKHLQALAKYLIKMANLNSSETVVS